MYRTLSPIYQKFIPGILPYNKLDLLMTNLGLIDFN